MKNEEKYIVKRNNYVGLLFFALVLAASLYIIKHETSAFLDLSTKEEKAKFEEVTRNLDINTDIIEELSGYLNPGSINTKEIYQSMYIYNEKVTNKDFDDTSAIYTAFLYIDNNTKAEERNLSCEEASKININNLKECDPRGTDTIENYKVHSYITKDKMDSTVRMIFNRNLNSYPDFYISNKDKCYFVDEAYICLNGQGVKDSYAERTLVSGIEQENTITITEIYRYVSSGIGYKGFNSKEIGESKYKSTFKKVNGSYYWVSTEYIDN
jgi:hypothetical protein